MGISGFSQVESSADEKTEEYFRASASVKPLWRASGCLTKVPILEKFTL